MIPFLFVSGCALFLVSRVEVEGEASLSFFFSFVAFSRVASGAFGLLVIVCKCLVSLFLFGKTLAVPKSVM